MVPLGQVHVSYTAVKMFVSWQVGCMAAHSMQDRQSGADARQHIYTRQKRSMLYGPQVACISRTGWQRNIRTIAGVCYALQEQHAYELGNVTYQTAKFVAWRPAHSTGPVACRAWVARPRLVAVLRHINVCACRLQEHRGRAGSMLVEYVCTLPACFPECWGPTACCLACQNQSINQLHVYLARGEPTKGATPKPPLVIPNR
jgi:hypothetical protein